MTDSSRIAKSVSVRFRRAAVILLINTVVTAVLLAAVEFLLAAGAPDLPQNGRFAGELYTWGHRVTNNRLGFRERDFDMPKPDTTYRVMVLGDSLTWGAGLATAERYTAITEELLNTPARLHRFEVLNFGLPGGPSTLERDVLREHVDAVDPDLIVVGFCLNDTQPRPQDQSVEREQFDRGAGRTVRGAAATLARLGLPRVGRLLHDGLYRLAEITGRFPVWQVALQRTYEPGSPEWQAFEQALADIKTLSDLRGLPAPVFAVLNQGTFTDRPTDYAHPDEELERYLRWYHLAEAAARRAGFTTHHHEVEIAARLAAEPLSVNSADGHPSARLNRLYAERLSEAIEERLADPTGLRQRDFRALRTPKHRMP